MRRFAPPDLEIDAALRWLLLRAFAPQETPVPAVAPARALEVVRRSGLAPRIAHRHGGERLEGELGDAAAPLLRAASTARAHAVAYEALLERIAEIASGSDATLLPLKGVALHIGGYSPPGSRHIGDLDLLVDTAHAPRLQRRLQAAGFTPSDGDRNEHHLPTLNAPDWGRIDLHDRLRGVAGHSGRWRTAADVDSRDCGPRGVRLPDRPFLAAHLLAHGLDQHICAPQPFPLLRTLADLIDVLDPGDGWSEVTPTLAPLLRCSLPAAELDTALDLCRTLRRGGLPPIGSAPRQLLLHLIAHGTDSEYRSTLRWRHRRRRLRQAWRQRRLLAFAGRKWTDLQR